MDWLKQFDTDLFLAINSWHAPWADWFFYSISLRWVWIPVYLFFIYLLLQSYGWKSGSVYTLAIILTVISADLLSVYLFKDWTHRLRPCHNPDINTQVHLYRNDCGGLYGFVSSHAANFAAWCTLGFLWLRKKWKKTAWTLWLCLLLVGYSRVYLGRHYPADVACGAIMGFGLALAVFFSLKKWYKLAA